MPASFSRSILLPALFLTAMGVGWAEDWPPTLDTQSTTTHALDGRLIERYWHGPRPAWGYPADTAWTYPPAQETSIPGQNHNSFYVVTPQVPRAHAPLWVVLHSANRTAYDFLGFACLGRKLAPSDDPATAMTNPPDDVYALFLNSTNSEWWGWTQARANEVQGLHTPPAAERRVLDTIAWVADRYKIDRDRIYLTGISMGGCGTLGIGLNHGDIFAALRVTVPAGTGYANYSRGGFAPAPAFDATPAERDAWVRRASGEGLPDPPVVVDFSSPQDGWSNTQPALVEAAQGGRLPLVLGWGPFGHATFGSQVDKYALCEVVHAFPWSDIRRHEAYPVFTHASCDQAAPWLDAPAEFPESGQLNAWFRWKTTEDSTSALHMQLWLGSPETKNPVTAPTSATANVTLRRLQAFEVRPGREYSWQLTRAGAALASGRLSSDASHLLTFPQLPLAQAPAELVVTPAN